MKIGEILLQAGHIRADQLEAALEAQRGSPVKRRLGEWLVEAGALSDSALMHALGVQFHVPVLETIPAHAVDPALLERIPVEWARQHVVLPLRWDHDVVAVMADPASLPRLEELSLLMGRELSGMLAPAAEIKRAIDTAYFERSSDSAAAPMRETAAPAASDAGPGERTDDLLRMSDSAPVTQLMNGIILEAVRKKASDIHIEPFENHLRIRFRIDGFLYDHVAPPKHLEQALISRLKVMSKLDIAERRLPQDGMAKVRAGEREIDIRVSTVPVAEGERVVLRLLNQSSTLLPLGELGMPDAWLEQLRRLLALPHGMILVTGPTGSGKTTTLYAALRELDTEHLNVMTIEDPIEYQVPNIGQIQVKPKIGLDFASGLRHILRQDPDVILVGEIRDQETAEIAVRSALTGHLVFSTLHTNDAASAMVRLVDMGIEPYLLGSSVRAVLAQRLVRRLCPSCRVMKPLDAATLAGFSAEQQRGLGGAQTGHPKGCPACRQGYRGRVGLYELMVVGPREQQAMRGTLHVDNLRALAAAQGRTMWQDAMNKVMAGVTSLDEVLRVLEPDNRSPAS